MNLLHSFLHVLVRNYTCPKLHVPIGNKIIIKLFVFASVPRRERERKWTGKKLKKYAKKHHKIPFLNSN